MLEVWDGGVNMESVLWSVRIAVGIYLIIMAVIDFKEKEIPLLPGLVLMGTSAVLLLVCGDSLMMISLGVGVGLFIYAVSRISCGGIGAADGLVYAVTGVCLGFYGNLELLLISLLMAAFVGGALMIIKKVGRKYRMPFVPFTLAGYVLVMMAQCTGG